jgi:connector enhancer of kinase suppressor of Ras 2
LKGIEIINPKHLSAFFNNEINGSKLLNIRPYELCELGIKKIGHQEIILEAIEHLKNFVSWILSILCILLDVDDSFV